MDDRSGCLGGLLKLFLLDVVLDFLQERFGWGRGCSCGGCGCGLILFIIGIIFFCSILTTTDWTSLTF